jgi:excisionase family DNA binding protein
MGGSARDLPDGWRGKYVTAAQAAEFLAVHVRTVHRYAQEERLTPYYIRGSRAVRFLRTDVEGLIVPDGEE